jgi:hypothetical protein
MFTAEQKAAWHKLKDEKTFEDSFNWWQNKVNNELFVRLDAETVFAIHPSGVVTEHIHKKNEVA